MDQETAGILADECAFSHYGFFRAQDLVFMPEVRDMCTADKCGKYGKYWTCPPACGTLEDAARRVSHFSWGILLQSTGLMEDAFDAETLMETEDAQKARFEAFVQKLRATQPAGSFLPMSSGGCSICGKCTYPDAPCRFPDRAIPSMEALGLMVNDVCKLSGIPYYYGRNTITYSACVLFQDA